MAKREDLHKICTLLDKLTIDALTQMEQHIQCKIDMETTISEGESHLSKARYIMGHSKVSALQLPTEETAEFEALAIVHSEKAEHSTGELVYDLEMRRPEKFEEDSKLLDPLRWFGILVPRNLQAAQVKYKQALLSAVHAANIQNQLKNTCDTIDKLTVVKNNLLAGN